MEPQTWVALIVGVFAILSALFGMAKWVIKAIMQEIGPEANGTSIREQVNRLERNIQRLESRIDAILLER